MVYINFHLLYEKLKKLTNKKAKKFMLKKIT